MVSMTFPVLLMAAVFVFHAETSYGKTLETNRDKRAPITDPNKLMNAISLDPRLKEEYKQVFVKLLEQHLDKNPKLAENFFAYPRGGRAMNFFHWPRGGKRVDGLADDTCCSEGVIQIYGKVGVKAFCSSSQCCEGLEKRYLEENEDSLSVLCVPEGHGSS